MASTSHIVGHVLAPTVFTVPFLKSNTNQNSFLINTDTANII